MQPGLSSTPSTLQELCNLQAQASCPLSTLLHGTSSADSHISLDGYSAESAGINTSTLLLCVLASAQWLDALSHLHLLLCFYCDVIKVLLSVSVLPCCRHTWLDHNIVTHTSMLTLLKPQWPCMFAGTVAAASVVPVAAALQKQGSGL